MHLKNHDGFFDAFKNRDGRVGTEEEEAMEMEEPLPPTLPPAPPPTPTPAQTLPRQCGANKLKQCSARCVQGAWDEHAFNTFVAADA